MNLAGRAVRLRPATAEDVAALARIRKTPEVRARWRGEELEQEIADDLDDDELHVFVVLDEDDSVVGAVQWSEEQEPDYRHATIDIFIDPSMHDRGFGSDAVRTLARHLFDHGDHHRITIDPAADNAPAIACYAKVGFRPVGVMRQYERVVDGRWHDGLLMELLREDLEG